MRGSTNKICLNCDSCEGCINCTNCEGCVGCINCTGCTNCVGCIDCEGCSDCEFCKLCTNCEYCDNCNGCRNCEYCEEGIGLIKTRNYYPFTEAKYSFPQKGCCIYFPFVEELLINNKFNAYNSVIELRNLNPKYLVWNYGILYRRYWFTKRPTKYLFEISSLLNFVMINKLYYNNDSDVSIGRIIENGLDSRFLVDFYKNQIENNE